MPPPPYGLPEVSHFTWSHPRLPAASALFIPASPYIQLWAAGNQPPTPPLSAFIIPQYFSFVKYFIRLFWNYFYFFSASIARSTDVPLRVSTAPSLRAALWFSRLRRLQSCFKQKGILYLRE